MKRGTVGELFLRRVHERRDASLLVDAQTGAASSYERAADRALRWAAFFRSRGLGAGSRVGIALPNSIDLAESYLGGALAGVTLCPYNPALSDSEIAALAQRFRCELLLTSAPRDERLEAMTGIATVSVGSKGLLPAELPPPLPLTDLPIVEPDAVLVMIMTSGTTGGVKACRIRHRNVCFTAEQTVKAFELAETSRYLTPLPLFHINPQVIGLLAAITAGGSVAIGPRLPAAKLWEAARRCQATGMSAVPALIHDLLELDTKPPPSLEYIVCSSAPLPENVQRRFEAKTGVRILVCYGLSEAGCYVTYTPRSGGGPIGSVGVPIGCEVRIVTDGGRTAAIGELGAITARGDGIMEGYDGDPEATRAALRDGWLHTGDEGYLDARGYLHVVGRTKEMINRGGEKIAPNHIEPVLLEHSAIAEASVFPVPHDRLGEEVAAAVVLRSDAQISDDDLEDFCQGRLADFEIPRRWFRLDALPRGGTGKVLRRELQRRFGGT